MQFDDQFIIIIDRLPLGDPHVSSRGSRRRRLGIPHHGGTGSWNRDKQSGYCGSDGKAPGGPGDYLQAIPEIADFPRNTKNDGLENDH